MASISNDPGGRRRICFRDRDGVRRTIRLGKCSKRDAESVKAHVERLVGAAIARTAPPDDTTRWLCDLGDDLHGKLVAAGLVTPRAATNVTRLGPFLAAYMEARTDLKVPTRHKLRTTQKALSAFFGESKPLADVTPGDADDFRRSLVAKKHADNTVRKHLSIAKQFFRDALRRRLIEENPFDGLASSTRPNPDRMFFITPAMTDAILDQCPDSQWRLIVALSRFGGLRCPSEHFGLRWGDIDWERGRMTVTSPKTEHHVGKGTRVVPIFPELRPYLEAVFDEAPEGSEHVITRWRSANQNLRTHLLRMIGRAGLTPWPKLFHNLRSSRQTELEERFPSHVVCSWIGNSEKVARNHYLQVTDAHFQKATTGPAEAARNPAQYTAVYTGNEPQAGKDDDADSAVFPGFAIRRNSLQGKGMAVEGLEPTTHGL